MEVVNAAIFTDFNRCCAVVLKISSVVILDAAVQVLFLILKIAVAAGNRLQLLNVKLLVEDFAFLYGLKETILLLFISDACSFKLFNDILFGELCNALSLECR